MTIGLAVGAVVVIGAAFWGFQYLYLGSVPVIEHYGAGADKATRVQDVGRVDCEDQRWHSLFGKQRGIY